MARINFVELPAANIAETKAFYAQAFGFELTDFGPTYACTMSGDVDLGLQGAIQEASQAPLPVLAVEALDPMLAAVVAAGGTVTVPIFAFPGGRRFQFRDPSGNELAVMQSD